MVKLARWLGVLATLVLMAASMSMNALYVHGQGQSPTEGAVFVALSVAADLWKAILPVVIAAAWTERDRGRAAAGVVLLLFLIGFSFGSALGYAAMNRGFLSGTREMATARLNGLGREAERIDIEISRLGEVRASALIEAEIAQARADRFYAASQSCREPSGREAREVCRRLRALEVELAAAAEKGRLKAALVEVRREREQLAAAGAGQDSDAQAGYIARVTGFAMPRVRDALIVMVAVVVELGSAFGLLVAGIGARRTKPEAAATAEAVKPTRAVSRRVGSRKSPSASPSRELH